MRICQPHTNKLAQNKQTYSNVGTVILSRCYHNNKFFIFFQKLFMFVMLQSEDWIQTLVLTHVSQLCFQKEKKKILNSQVDLSLTETKEN